MSPPVDLSLYIPVNCTQEDAPKYNGKCFMEAISMVQKLNGESILSDRGLTKEDFKTSNTVLLKFRNRNYSGIVDFSLNKGNVSKHGDSPLVGSSPSSSEIEVETKSPLPLSVQRESTAKSVTVSAAGTPTTTTITIARARKRVRKDYPLPPLFVLPKPKKSRNKTGGSPRKRRASGGIA